MKFGKDEKALDKTAEVETHRCVRINLARELYPVEAVLVLLFICPIASILYLHLLGGFGFELFPDRLDLVRNHVVDEAHVLVERDQLALRVHAKEVRDELHAQLGVNLAVRDFHVLRRGGDDSSSAQPQPK